MLSKKKRKIGCSCSKICTASFGKYQKLKKISRTLMSYCKRLSPKLTTSNPIRIRNQFSRSFKNINKPQLVFASQRKKRKTLGSNLSRIPIQITSDLEEQRQGSSLPWAAGTTCIASKRKMKITNTMTKVTMMIAQMIHLKIPKRKVESSKIERRAATMRLMKMAF